MEQKERGFVGKHYLMKQAFSQEELHRREAVCTREDPPGCTAALPAPAGYARGLRPCGKRRFCKGSRGDPCSHALSVSAVRSMFRHVCGSLRAFPGWETGYG